MKRVIILLDGANLYHCQAERKIEIDLDKLREQLVSKVAAEEKTQIDLIGVFYRNAALADQVDDKKKAFSAHRGFSVEIHSLKTRPADEAYCEGCNDKVEVVCSRCGNKKLTRRVQKGVDVGLATDLLALAFRNAFDVAILVTGDQDFIGPVKMIKLEGKKVYNAFFATVGKSDELAQECYDFWAIEDFEKEVTRAPFVVSNWMPLIEALDRAQAYFKAKGGFVALGHFADKWITPAMGVKTREEQYKFVNAGIERGIIQKGLSSSTTTIELNEANDLVKEFRAKKVSLH